MLLFTLVTLTFGVSPVQATPDTDVANKQNYSTDVIYQIITDRLVDGNTANRCGGEMEIIAFITEAPTVRAILTHIGEPSEAPPISPCRGPPEWEMLAQTAEFDPVHPVPEYEFDQSVSW
jgi:hypothetical protein